ncbi:MAG: beta-Ala-His dipeptidase, partial [Succiniclasticum sp.]
MRKCLWIMIASLLLFTGMFPGSCNAEAATKDNGQEIINKVVDNFKLLAQVPRPSHHEEKISEFLTGWAKQQGFQVQRDKQNNIMFDVPATSGYEKLPLTILQGHMDMVCVAAEGVTFDPLKDPIKVVRDEKAGTLKADGTSLGGDDGTGVSMIMLAVQGGLKHGPLRVIITTDEEDGMEGAFGLSPDWLADAHYLINLDNEASDEVLVSTAAGDSVKVTGTVTLQKPVGDTAVMLELKGLKGGHSGIEIDKGRCNGLIAMARLLKAIRAQGLEFGLVSFGGGTAPNAIPAKADAVIMIKAAERETLKKITDSYLRSLQKKYAGIEDGIQLLIKDVPVAAQVLSAKDRDNAILFVDEIIDGVKTWSADMKGLVESSSNLGIFTADKSGIAARTYVRSSVGDLEERIVQSQEELALRCFYHSEVIKMADPWPYNPRSKLLALAKQAYKKLNGKEIKVVAVHAGLECGTFAK